MSIEATSTATATITNSSDVSSTATTSTKSSSSTDGKSFKDELNTVKSKDSTTAKTGDAEKAENDAETQTAAQTASQKTTEETAKNNLTQQVNKNQLGQDEDNENTKLSNPIDELKAQIETLNNIKSGFVSKVGSTDSKSSEKTSDKSDYCQTIKMDSNDAKFFLSLVDNQQMTAQGAQANNSSGTNSTFTDIKSEATQQTVQVSATLMDALNESSKTNKPFRIDFDNDVAVIMKVDKEGTLSANFIPGSAAVEQYLRNNIDGLRQSFNNQNLQYGELTYSKEQKQDQREQREQQNNKKENENE